jgi:hypothetical protein
MVSLPQVTVTFGASYAEPAPGYCERSGNSALSAPQVTEEDVSLDDDDSTVVVVLVVVVDLERIAAFFTSEESEDPPHAARVPRLTTARKGTRRFLMCTLYTFFSSVP